MDRPLHLGVIGIDHAHIFGMLAGMRAQGCTCAGYYSAIPTANDAGFASTFPDIPRLTDPQSLLDDPRIDMILISAIPADRADWAIAAMRAGKDVMVDKPGCTTPAQLAAIRAVQAETGRIWTVNFSERFEVPAVARAEALVAAGAIGTVKQTLGIGPHRQGLHQRPDWFWDRARFGGILCDIGSHQIDQFLHFTGAHEATITHALAENTTRPDRPGFQDFGEITLTAPGAHGYIRVDWFTPGALPTWGDGRLFILGDKGHIEIRKYLDIAREGGNQLYLANGDTVARMDCSTEPLPYFPRLVHDIRHRGETAVPQAHTFRVMELALQAQAIADAQA